MARSYTRAFICLSIFLLSIRVSFAQQFNWVKGGGTTVSGSLATANPESARYLCTDANGNVYAASLVGNATVHADTFSGAAYGYSILVSSYNCSGQMRWAKLITSSGGNCSSYGIAADSLGHIYIAGLMRTATLHIGYDTTITGIPYENHALVQLDTNGHFNWIRYVGDNTPSTLSSAVGYGSSLAIDSADNVHFFNSMRYGVHITPSLTSHSGTYDLMYSPSGALLSVKHLEIDSTLNVDGVTIDKQSNKAFGYGYRMGSFWTGGGTGGDSSAYNFIAEFDTSRNLKWIDTIGDPPAANLGLFTGVTTDGAGHLYACGGGNGFLVYQGDTIAPPVGAVGGYITFIMKLDTAGNKKWVKQCNGNSVCSFRNLTLMPNNRVAAVGEFYQLVNSGSITINAGVGTDPFFAVVDTGGTLIALRQLHDYAYYDYGYSITSDKIGNLYIGGAVGDSLPDAIIPAYHSIGGNTDFFVLKYGVDCSCTSTPVASYTYTGTSTVNVTYTGTTSGLDSVVWNFGDGTTGLGVTATHVYTVVGTVDLCVTVYTSCGYDIKCNSVMVNCTGAPVASFTDTGTTVHGFIYTGTTAGLTTITWNFGDGHTATGTTALHTYSTSATYNVCAVVHTGCGNDTVCNNIVINCTALSGFTWSGSLPVNFNYTGTTATLDSVTWNFGDGSNATGTALSHSYSVSGTYNVCATAYTACGSNTACNTITVSCTPASSFTWSGSSPVSFNYTGSTTAVDSVTWDFGDGGTGTGNTPSHAYGASGTYNVCATVYTTCGSHTACNAVVVSCSPVSSFTHSGLLPVSFNYNGSMIGVDSVAWDLGDGGTATGMTPSHSYGAVGSYTVCATVYTTCGSDDSCMAVNIPCIAAPVAAFTDTGSQVRGFAYTGTTVAIDSVVWDFSDGGTANGLTAMHNYAVADTYHVCVTVYTACGNDSACHEIIVLPLGAGTVAFAGVKVYPNPATDELRVTGLVSATGYRLLNITGLCLQYGILQPGAAAITLQDCAAGIYILEMTDANGVKKMVRVVKG